MRERGPGAAGHHSRQPAPLQSQPIVANGVHTPVEAAQPAAPYPLRNPPVTEPEIDELRTGDHAPLPLGEPSQEG